MSATTDGATVGPKGGTSSESSSAAACCAAFYEQDWVRTLLGDSFHPGGEAMSRRLIDSLALGDGERVLDLACGTGTTALMIADGGNVEVTGVDYSQSNLDRAAARAAKRPRAGTARFVRAEADALPFEPGSFDAATCECAVSTFADKPVVAAGLRRMLRPGGRLAISDMAVYEALPEDLAAFGRGWACVDDALTVEGYRDLFVSAGFTLKAVVDERDALLEMVVMLKKKLVIAAVGAMLASADAPDVAQLRDALDRARGLVERGAVRYARLLFEA